MLALLLALAVSPPPRPGVSPSAWSFEIHELICDIAWRELTPVARAEVTRLLATERPAESFPASCIWADRVRGEEAYRWTAPAHYLNLPRGADRFDATRDCSTICVATAIPRFLAILRDRGATDSVRREALKFVGHFVGDVHQPLHAGYGDDRGGNGTVVWFLGDSTNLHRLWDGELPRALGLDAGSGARLHAAIGPVDRTRWSMVLDPVRWAVESYAIVERQVYADLVDSAAGHDYVERNRHAVFVQIQAAGVRLGALLNRALGS